MSVREALRPSILRLRWRKRFADRVLLAAVWALYRLVNLLPSRSSDNPISTEHLAQENEQAIWLAQTTVERFAVTDTFLTVHNVGFEDGRAISILVVQVRGDGPQPESAHV